MKNAINKVKIFILLAVFTGFMLNAQDNPERSLFWEYQPKPETRPKIALVLSGGAAYGFAHVGFLKVFEEVGIPVDIVIGNSMGTLIGGLYSIGYSPGDIEELAGLINWGEIFSYKEQNLGKRLLDQEATMFSLAFDSGGIINGNGLIQDQNLTLLFSRLTYKVSMTRDFLRLPVPFKTVAVDLKSGREILMDRGILSEAMRSSMSIPAVFPPVDVGNYYLVDGGMRNNNPIDLAIDWGADIIIDVSVSSFHPREREELDNLVTILDQTSRIMASASYKALTFGDKADYRLDIDLRDFSRMDFARNAEIIRRGEEAARASLPALEALAEEIGQRRSLEPRDWRRKGTYEDLALPVFSQVRFEGALRLSRLYVDSLFDEMLNEPVDLDRLDQRIEILRTRGDYETIGYYLESLPDGTYCLVLNGVPRRQRDHDVSFGLNFQLTTGSDTEMNARANLGLNLKDLTYPKSLIQARVSYLFNQGPEGFFLYRHPLSSYFSVEPFVDGGYLSSKITASRPRGDLSRYSYLNTGANFLFHVKDWWDFYLGYRFSMNHFEAIKYNFDNPLVTTEKEYRGLLHLATLGTQWNSSDSNFFVRQGFTGNLTLTVPFAGKGLAALLEFPWYESIDIYHRHFFTPVRYRTFFVDVHAASYRGELESPWTLFSVGGENGIPGYYEYDGYGRDRLLFGLGYIEEIKALTRFLGFDTYFMAQARVGNIWEEILSFEDFLNIKAGLRVGIDMATALGNLFVGCSVSLEGQVQFNLYFN